MKVSSWAVGRPITTLMASMAIVVLGLVSYRQLAVQLIPDIEFPTVAVYAGAPDKSTQENLDNITKEVEAIMAEMPRVKEIFSFTGPSFVWIRADFEFGTDTQYVIVDLEERLATFRNQLNDPRVYLDAFPFSTAEFVATFMELAVQGEGDIEALFDTASDKVEQQLRSISGVAQVEMRGLTADAAYVDISTDLLAAYQLNFGQVFQKIQTARADDTFLGQLRTPGETYYVRTDDKVRNLQQLGELFVDSRGIVKLKDISQVTAGKAVDDWVNRIEGKNAIGIEMQREAGENMIQLARKTRERVEEINKTLPDGVELVIIEDYAKYIEDAIGQVKKLAGLGALLALLVPLIFFRSVRVALIVFVSVPISLIAVFNLFYYFGMSINILSIIGLALGVGMLVDNAIVVVENSFRLHSKGHSPSQAASLGGVEVGRGLFAATLTTVAVFVPMVFLDGEFKLFIKEPTLALVFPLMLSLLVALTLVPVFTATVLRTIKPTALRGGKTWFRGAYSKLLKAALRHRGRVIFLIVLALMFTTLESCQRIRQSAQTQEANNETFRVFYQALPSSTLSEVNRAVSALEDRLLEHPDIDTFQVWFNSERGGAWIKLKEIAEREEKRSLAEIRGTMVDFIGPIPGIDISLRRRDQPLAEPSVNLGARGQVDVRGIDEIVVAAYADRMVEAMLGLPNITNAEIEREPADPLMLARVDRDKSSLFDVTSENMGQYVGATRASGTITSLVIDDGDKRTNVSVTIDNALGDTLDDVRAMTVWSPAGGTVPFGDLSRFATSTSQTRIRRRDRQSSIDIDYFYEPTADVGKINEDIKKLIAAMPNPGGVVATVEGEGRRIDDRQTDFFFMILAGTLLIYVVMAAVFESFWVPFIIVLTNPLMLIGIVWGLDIAGLPLDDLAAFGIILLVGLAVNNGIVLMDRALSLQRAGYSRTRSVFEASVTRLRPIVMTYLTTVLGLAPLALFGQEGDQWRPVAVVIIGGLTSATILTLVVLPCFYMIGDDFVSWFRPYFLAFLAASFRAVELVMNKAAAGLKGALFVWRWRPLTWPRRGFAFARAAVAWLVVVPVRLVKLLWRAARGAVRGVFSVLGDVRFLVKRLLGMKETAAPDAPAIANPEREEATGALIQLSNVQVFFPAPFAATMVAKLRRREPPRVHALRGVALTMERGLVGLLGPNGAGKTTLLRCIAGLLTPTRGAVRVLGTTHHEAPEELAPLIGYLPQNHGHYDWMTLGEYLEYFALLASRTIQRARAVERHTPLGRRLAELVPLDNRAQRLAAVAAAAREVNLEQCLDQKIGTFSGGMRQRAGIARVLLQSPPVVIVDEPTAGLDPVERVKVRLLLSRLAENRLVIFSTHIVEDLEHACDQLAILQAGAVVWQGTPEDLRAAHEGRLWDVIPEDGSSVEDARTSLTAQGCRVLFQVLHNGREALRVLSGAAPTATATPVKPSLEESLLTVLGGR